MAKTSEKLASKTIKETPYANTFNELTFIKDFVNIVILKLPEGPIHKIGDHA
jgi:hypothetical protein